TLDQYPAQVFDYSRFGEERLDTFVSLDIRVDKRWNFTGWTLDLYLDIQNVFANSLPSLPQYGLDRDDEGSVLDPQRLVEIPDLENASVIPTLGIVVDF
ncbi:MAG: hypothetical protein WBW88_15285, partial [Rhodothermales bacterium]